MLIIFYLSLLQKNYIQSTNELFIQNFYAPRFTICLQICWRR